MALITLLELKTALGITDSASDTRLTRIIAAATAMINAYVGVTSVETTSYTEYVNPGPGAELITLKLPPSRCPITITSLYEDTTRAWAVGTLLASGTDYLQEKVGGTGIIRLNQNWLYSLRTMPDRLAPVLLAQIGTVKAVYTIDNAELLAVAGEAALAESIARYNAFLNGASIGNVTSDTMDGASVRIDTNIKGNSGRKANSADGFTSPLVAGWLDPWRKVSIGIV